MKKGFTHEKSGHGDTDVWLTPLGIIRALGEFDLDPCGYPGHGTARSLICEPEDGLSRYWGDLDQRVWLNPPYGRRVGDWLEKLSRHGNGIALTFARTDTLWFQRSGRMADGFLFLKGRIQFLRPDCTVADQAAAPSVLIAFGQRNARILEECGLPGIFLCG